MEVRVCVLGNVLTAEMLLNKDELGEIQCMMTTEEVGKRQNGTIRYQCSTLHSVCRVIVAASWQKQLAAGKANAVMRYRVSRYRTERNRAQR